VLQVVGRPSVMLSSWFGCNFLGLLFWSGGCIALDLDMINVFRLNECREVILNTWTQ
jgi:hypothetical protein